MAYAEAIGADSHLIDTGLYRPRLAGCYLIADQDELAIVDTGTMHTLPRILDTIAALGASPEQVRYIMPTHVHLDHAGGSGQLMQACRNATLIVHPKGLPHMVDPSKLQAGATAVYGAEAFARDFGELLPIAEERTVAATNLQSFALGSRTLQFIHTPGHANHHGCIFDRHSGYLYTGDTFGLGYEEFRPGGNPLLLATTTPVAFDPDAWFASLDHMLGLAPSACCLTHFGKIDHPERHVDQLRASIQAHVDIALDEEQNNSEGRASRLRNAVDRLLVESASAYCDLAPARIRELLAVDIELNAQGLEIWLKRRAKKRG